MNLNEPMKLNIMDNKEPIKLNIMNKKIPIKLSVTHEKEPIKLNSTKFNIIHEKEPIKLNSTKLNSTKLNIIYEKEPIKLNIISSSDVKEEVKPMKLYLNIIPKYFPSDHMCYILKSTTTNRIYIGYTINFDRRIRQHNGEIAGGAKKTMKGRPWKPICHVKGFYEESCTRRFEYRLQKSKKPRPNNMNNMLLVLKNLLSYGDGLLSWPLLSLCWFEPYVVNHNNVKNIRMY